MNNAFIACQFDKTPFTQPQMLTDSDPELPKIPKSFQHLYNIHYPNQPDETCDCGSVTCPHLQQQPMSKLFLSLNKRLRHLEAVAPLCQADIRQKLHCEIQKQFKSCGNASCHVARALKQLNGVQIQIQPLHSYEKAATVMIWVSFCSNIALLMAKTVAYAFSLSMAVLASLMDSAMDVLSGLVLFAAVKLARRGIKAGEYQKTLHDNEATIKYVYARRYESLGVLAYASIMGTLALVLTYECISRIVSLSKNNVEKIMFDALPLAIMLSTIFVKMVLFICCYYVVNHIRNPESLRAYKNDHFNDVLTNSIGVVGAALAFYLQGGWHYCDPVTSLILSLYILIIWSRTVVQQMKSLVGRPASQALLDELMMHIIHQFVVSVYILEVRNLVGYSSSGCSQIIEVSIVIAQNSSAITSHDICQTIQNEFEKLCDIERCYVHIEPLNCLNGFE